MPKKPDHTKNQNTSDGTPQKTAKQWVEQGNTHFSQSRYNEALAAYKEAIKRDAKMVPARIGRGNALLELGYYQSALDAYERAIQLKPNSAEAHIGRGKALMMLDED